MALGDAALVDVVTNVPPEEGPETGWIGEAGSEGKTMNSWVLLLRECTRTFRVEGKIVDKVILY